MHVTMFMFLSMTLQSLLYDEVFPYVYDVSLIYYVNEGPTLLHVVKYSIMLKCEVHVFDAYGLMIGLITMSEVIGSTCTLHQQTQDIIVCNFIHYGSV